MNGKRLRTLPLSSTFVDALLLAMARALKDEAAKRGKPWKRRIDSVDGVATKILDLVHECGKIRRTELRRMVGCANSKIAPAIFILLEKGLITETAIKSNGRTATEYSITLDGSVARLREAAA